MELLIDSREQLPLWDVPLLFPSSAKIGIKKIKLDVGDYTTSDLLGHLHIERKSPVDLYGSIIQGHNRFRRELIRAMATGIKLYVYIECSESMFYSKRFANGWRLKVKGNQLAKIVKSLEVRYNISYVWCNDRNDMRIKILRHLDSAESSLLGRTPIFPVEFSKYPLAVNRGVVLDD